MATINDIAKIAGVSTSTVSHVVNKTRYVSPELVERVEKAIQEADSVPNFVAKKTNGLKKNASARYILFLMSDRNSAFQQRIEKRLEECLGETEYVLISIRYNRDVKRLEIVKDYLVNTPGIAGVIVFPDEEQAVAEHLLNYTRVPVVVLGRKLRDFKADTIVSNTYEGAYKATKHLIKNGHENIAFLGSAQDKNPKRFQGYCQALTDMGMTLTEGYAAANLQSEQELVEMLDGLFSSSQIPTAVLAANSAVLIPLLQYIDIHNIECPKDLSIVSFNESDWVTLHTPQITTVEQDTKEFARRAVEILMERIAESGFAKKDSKKTEYQTTVLPTKLCVRASTCGIGRGPFGEKAETADALILSDNEAEVIRKKNYTAAISFHYAGKAWMKLHQDGIKDIFDNFGISLIAITDAHFDPQLQCKQLDSLRLLEPDIIIAIPTDNNQTSEAFQRIVDSNSKLILIANVPEGLTPKDYVSCVSTNEHSHGRNMGTGLGEYMLRHGLKNAALVKHGAKDFYTTNQRDNAAEQVLIEEFPEVNICAVMEFDNEREVYQKTVELMKHHPEIEALYVSWDGPAMEVIAALSEMNRTDVCVVTGDLDYPIAMNMAKGGMVKVLSAQCPFEQGQAIGLVAANALLGKPTPSFIGIEPISVTLDNLLRAWKQVFKEEAPVELKQAFRQNPNYFEMKSEN